MKRDCYIKNADATKIQNIQKIQNKISKSNVPGKFWKTIKYQKRRYKENPVLQIEYNKMKYQENPEILREYQ